jgi:hypothetical protein
MLAILALLALGGCGGGDKKSSGSSGKTETTASPQATATTPAGKPAAAPEKALAGRAGTIDGKAVQLEIVQLKRSGESTALTLRLRKQTTGGAQVAGTFDDGLFEKLKNSDNSVAGGNTLDGISLIDSKNRKRYLVGRDSNNACVCDVDLSTAFVYPDSPLLLSATFGAPPADVTSVDVVVPKFGTFKDVPLS